MRGFTKIELIVALAIVGILASLSAVALNSARERARDAKRIADVARTQVALELYFNDHNSYPVLTSATALGSSAARCLAGEGFVPSCDTQTESVYLERVPSTPTDGLGELVGCSGAENAYCYVGEAEAYRIQFEVENDNPEGKLQAGVNCATESGIVAGACEAL